MKVTIVAAFALMLLMFSTRVGAGSNPPSEESSAGIQAEIPEFEAITVTPLPRMPAIIPPAHRVPQPPVPLADTVRSTLLAQVAGAGARLQDSFLLDARTPFVEGRGYLNLSLPFTFHPESPIVFDARHPARISVHLNVEKGGAYLVDFAVAARGGAGSYRVDSESGSMEFADTEGKLGHVLLALHAAASGWTSLRLARNDDSFYLYSVEITQVNQGNP